MRTKGLKYIARDRAALALTTGALFTLAVGGLAPAQAANPPRLPAQFSGLLNDYSPTMTNGSTGTAISGSPYEMHGKWILDLNEARGTATFSAELSMETADFANPDTMNHDPTKLNPHTHHIRVTDGVIHNDPTGDRVNWMTSCGSPLKPALQGGFVVTGSAWVTANGTNPPAPLTNPTPVTICVLGGLSTGAPGSVSVTYSNFSLTFQPPDPTTSPGVKNASAHFGTLPINGVVVKCEAAPGLLGELLPSSACTVSVAE